MSVYKDKEITIAGVITTMKTGKTKKGNDFGILTIEDFTGTFEIPLFGEDYIKFRNYFILETPVYVRGRVQEKRWGRSGELTFNVLAISLLSESGKELIRSITLKVNVEDLTHDVVTDLYVLLNKEEGDLPLNFILSDNSGHQVKTFSRTCKIGRSKELYEYFDKNSAIEMKFN